MCLILNPREKGIGSYVVQTTLPLGYITKVEIRRTPIEGVIMALGSHPYNSLARQSAA